MENQAEYTDGIHAGVEDRKQRGLTIAALARIEQIDGYYVVPSQSNPKRYKVDMYPAVPTCTCPDYETRGCKCKHIYAVEFTLQRERSVTVEANGTTTVTESVDGPTKTRKTYPQNWPAYNEAQQMKNGSSRRCCGIFAKTFPRPRKSDAASVGYRCLTRCSVPSTRSTALSAPGDSPAIFATRSAKRYIDKVPHFNSVLNYLEDPGDVPASGQPD